MGTGHDKRRGHLGSFWRAQTSHLRLAFRNPTSGRHHDWGVISVIVSWLITVLNGLKSPLFKCAVAGLHQKFDWRRLVYLFDFLWGLHSVDFIGLRKAIVEVSSVI